MAKKAPKPRRLAIDRVDQLKALAHPLRMQLLDRFAAGPATTKQIAVALGLQPTRLYHHVAKLESAGLIELVDTKRVRGTTEKYYSPVAESLSIDRDAFDSDSADTVSDILQAGVLDNLLGMVRDEVADLLAQSDKHKSDQLQDEIMFAAAKLEINESDVPEFREKLAALLQEFGALAETAEDSTQQGREYRLMVGFYPGTTG